MFALKKTTLTLALSTGLALTLSACAQDTEPEVIATQDVETDAEPVADIDDLTGVSTAVDVDQSFLDGLASLDVTPGVVGDATLEDGTLTFPITGGDVTYYDPASGRDPFVEGQIEHEDSGLSLSSGGTTVELTDFVVDPGRSILSGTVSADGEVVQEDADLFFLDGRTLEPLRVDDEEGTVVLEGTTVSLTEEAADLLNETFGTDALTEFFLVGTATITIELTVAEATPSPSPTASPTASPTTSPTQSGSTAEPTGEPTAEPTAEPTDTQATPEPTPTS